MRRQFNHRVIDQINNATREIENMSTESKKPKSDKAENKEEGPRSFSVFLSALSDGEAHGQLSQEMYDLVRKLQEMAHLKGGKAKGMLTLKLGFVVNTTGVCAVAYDIDVKQPKKPKSDGIFWATKDGNLSPHNPKQQMLPLRDVSNPTEVVDLDGVVHPVANV